MMLQLLAVWIMPLQVAVAIVILYITLQGPSVVTSVVTGG